VQCTSKQISAWVVLHVRSKYWKHQSAYYRQSVWTAELVRQHKMIFYSSGNLKTIPTCEHC
jgi:hypothetical protein